MMRDLKCMGCVGVICVICCPQDVGCFLVLPTTVRYSRGELLYLYKIILNYALVQVVFSREI